MSSLTLAIVGPTAVGKTDLYLKLVDQGYPFEAIIADSRQVYRHMNIGTGKDIPPGFEDIFWLVDVVDPNQSFSSAVFCRLAHKAIAKIRNSGKTPVIVGGTGRYLKDLQSAPETLSILPDYQLRKKLSTCNLSQLQTILQTKNSSRFAGMNHSDKNNPRRLIRAIEVAESNIVAVKTPAININTICLTAPLQLIEVRIKARVEKRIEQGMINEVCQILEKYPDFSDYQSAKTPGYQEIVMYLTNQLTLKEAIGQWTKREIDYAKRQLTWFKYQSNAVWFDITKPNWYADVVKHLGEWGYGRNHS